MMRIILISLCGLILIGACEQVSADTASCRDAIDSYDAALSEVRDAIRAYATCVADSQGHDDCSSEFSALQSAQDEFKSAVSDYEGECS